MFWAKYGEATTFQFPVIARGVVDFALTANWTPAAADGALSKDYGVFTDLSAAAAITGGSPTRGAAMFTLALTGLQLQCAHAAVQIIDAATKTIEDQAIIINTWGHPSAYHKGDPFFKYPTPYPAEVTVTSFASDATAHAVSMPTACEAGDLLICFFTNDGNATVTTPTGWTNLHTTTDSGNAVRLGTYAKKADGTEGGTTVDFVTSATERAAAQVYRFQKGTWYGDSSNNFAASVAIGAAANGSSTSPDPPALAPLWKRLPTLYIAVEANDDGTVSASLYPLNYYDHVPTVSDANAAGVSLSTSMRTAVTNNENPAAYTITTQEWVTQTVAIRCPQPVARSNIMEVNNYNIDGDGAGTPWGPA